ncbi:MAG TPA: sigma-70 family RNA polymerase sigma factor [Terriglobia bacterium]|nr:sigma-70 family RNA polymerase sigma factor [Terriglobia bacterium]
MHVRKRATVLVCAHGGQKRDEDSVVHWLPLVRSIAASEFRRLGGLTKLLLIDLDDLIQTGTVGLLAAIEHFDPARSTSKTYFTRRIRWAILDFLRSFPYFKDGQPIAKESVNVLECQPVHNDELGKVETRVDVEKLTGLLSETQRQVILGIMHDVAQNSIASRLAVTEGRVSQIKRESLSAMRSWISTESAWGLGEA